MKILDFRVRPPFKSFMDCEVYDTQAMISWAKRFGVPLGKSAVEKSLDIFWQEIEQAHIEQVVIAGNLRKPVGVKNQDVNEFAELYKNKVLAAPCINPLNPVSAIEEINTYIINGACKAIMMEPGYLDEPLLADDKRIYPVYEFCQEKNIPVLLSIGGFCGPNVSFNNPMQIENVAAQFTNLKIAVCHACWPYAAEVCHVAMNREFVYLAPDMYVFNCPGADDYIRAANYLIPEKMIYGSAYPIFSLEESIAFYKNCGIQEKHFENLFHNNAATFFDL